MHHYGNTNESRQWNVQTIAQVSFSAKAILNLIFRPLALTGHSEINTVFPRLSAQALI